MVETESSKKNFSISTIKLKKKKVYKIIKLKLKNRRCNCTGFKSTAMNMPLTVRGIDLDPLDSLGYSTNKFP